MNRFHIISFILHTIIFVSLFIVNQFDTTPFPKIEVVKVTIAPLPQPRVKNIEEMIEEKEEEREPLPEPTEEEAVIVKKEEKQPPQEEKKQEKTEETAKKEVTKTKEVMKKGLPDIKPAVYTGSGRGFTYSYYLNILLNKIGKNWHNPFKDKDVILKSIVYFEVDKNGKIYNVRLEQNSGDEIYNESTIRAVTLTKRLPPLPQEFSDDYLKVHLEFLTAK